MSVKVSPSVLGADYLTLSEDIKLLEEAGVDMLHLDVMDGIFVPNISFGVPVIKSIKKHSNIPLDVHLMIDRPHRYIKEFAAVSDISSVTKYILAPMFLRGAACEFWAKCPAVRKQTPLLAASAGRKVVLFPKRMKSLLCCRKHCASMQMVHPTFW